MTLPVAAAAVAALCLPPCTDLLGRAGFKLHRRYPSDLSTAGCTGKQPAVLRGPILCHTLMPSSMPRIPGPVPFPGAPFIGPQRCYRHEHPLEGCQPGPCAAEPHAGARRPPRPCMPRSQGLAGPTAHTGDAWPARPPEPFPCMLGQCCAKWQGQRCIVLCAKQSTIAANLQGRAFKFAI